MLQLLDKQLIDATSAKAKESPRLRMNYNFHPTLDDKVQRLIPTGFSSFAPQQFKSKHLIAFGLASVLQLHGAWNEGGDTSSSC